MKNGFVLKKIHASYKGMLVKLLSKRFIPKPQKSISRTRVPLVRNPAMDGGGGV